MVQRYFDQIMSGLGIFLPLFGFVASYRIAVTRDHDQKAAIVPIA